MADIEQRYTKAFKNFNRKVETVVFYVKSELDKGVTLRTEINGEDVFTVCPGCGIEHMVDLGEILSSGDADLCSTQVYCHKCSKKRAQQHRGAEWAEQLVRE